MSSPVHRITPARPSRARVRLRIQTELTFGFIDISGFTHFNETQGDDAAVGILTDFRAAARAVSSSHGVRVERWLGDGVLLACRETAPLVQATFELEIRLLSAGFPLSVRAGIASGRVVLFEGDDYVGTPINLASRLCTEARPGQVLVTETVSRHLPRGVRRAPVGELAVRGLAEPVEVVALSCSARTAAVRAATRAVTRAVMAS